MLGKVIWYHPELRVALIERGGGFTVGTVEDGRLCLGSLVRGNLRDPGQTTLTNDVDGCPVGFLVEADALSEEEANELLGFVRDASSGKDDHAE
ncbi:hypothetical protein [Luteibacter sp. 9133]|uniref:hypothetical protein n=1 Tax=Luteibacter sp. 9133 TaxID=1500891 RepID=UPI0005B9A158|nr:hypothetical protein [Luteibacter sp. 9133]